MHRDLSEKQALCYALSFPPTKLELCTTRPEGTDSFIFDFPHPDARLVFEQAFDEAKRKLGKPGPRLVPSSQNLQAGDSILQLCVTSGARNLRIAMSCVPVPASGRVD